MWPFPHQSWVALPNGFDDCPFRRLNVGNLFCRARVWFPAFQGCHTVNLARVLAPWVRVSLLRVGIGVGSPVGFW